MGPFPPCSLGTTIQLFISCCPNNQIKWLLILVLPLMELSSRAVQQQKKGGIMSNISFTTNITTEDYLGVLLCFVLYILQCLYNFIQLKTQLQPFLFLLFSSHNNINENTFPLIEKEVRRGMLFYRKGMIVQISSHSSISYHQ